MTDTSIQHAAALAKEPLEVVTVCADNRDSVAENELGRRYGLGRGGVERDSQKSFHYYEKSSNDGYLQGKANLAYMYLNGEGTNRDLLLAIKLDSEAAEGGNPQAQYAMGYFYAMGKGVDRNGNLAEKWFVEAANQGYVKAQEALIRFYSDGDLVPRDLEKAVLWTHRTRDAELYGRVWRKDE
jgi:TPR repeat protein